METTGRVTNFDGDRVNADKLVADLNVLTADVAQLRRVAAREAGESITRVRAKAEESLKATGVRAAEMQETAMARTRAAGQAADEYVRANPWQVAAIAGAAGLLLGLLLSGSKDSDS
jgi:ElaB/YqjD/DUF883 family membrane-anchored ribosome-binding protein